MKLNLRVKLGTTENTGLSCSYNVILRTSTSTSDSPDAPFTLLWPSQSFQIGGKLLIIKKYLLASLFPRPHLARKKKMVLDSVEEEKGTIIFTELR